MAIISLNLLYLPEFVAPTPEPIPPECMQNAWYPFEDRLSFDFAHFHFVEVQTSAREINKALDMWAAQALRSGDKIPWANKDELYNSIDRIQNGDSPWRTHKLRYSGPMPPGTPPKWMTETYELCT